MSELRDKFFARNKRWASAKLAGDRDYFSKLSKGQAPQAFWLGCCDARLVPAEIVGASLGELFIQTTIANQVNPTSSVVTSAIEYAVTTLKVEHIIVCGHTHCGGIAAAISDTATGNVQQWLAPLRQLYLSQQHCMGDAEHTTALSELNVKHQVATIAALSALRDTSQAVCIHGWLFQVEVGLLREICCETV